MSDLIERIDRILLNDECLLGEARNEIERLQAENERLRVDQGQYEEELEGLREAVIDMECSCLPYADVTGEGVCQRCEALQEDSDE